MLWGARPWASARNEPEPHETSTLSPAWRPRGLSKSVVSRVIIGGVTPFRVLITVLRT